MVNYIIKWQGNQKNTHRFHDGCIASGAGGATTGKSATPYPARPGRRLSKSARRLP